MNFLVIDTETTDKEPEKALVVEIAAVLCNEEGHIEDVHQSLVRLPEGARIPPEAKAIHHIEDSFLAHAPDFDEAMAELQTFMPEDAMLVAHNALYDKTVLGLERLHWLCTYKMARTLFPQLDSFSNQYLRYKLESKPDASRLGASHAHRALYDAICTASLLPFLVKPLLEKGYDTAGMVDLCLRPVQLYKMPFGKYRGKTFEQIPRSYFTWMLNQHFGGGDFKLDEDLLFTVQQYA